MAKQEETLPAGSEQMSPGVILTNSLIAMKNLSQLVEPLHPQCQSLELLTPSTIRLDRQNICAIGRLRSLQELHSLYLQQNQIEEINNLSSFPNLRFLSLAGNRIQRVENLRPLRHLRVLDLSHNHIQRLDPDCGQGEEGNEELPRSLRLLDLTGNQCTQQHGYRELVLAALPHLLQLDAQPVSGSVGEEEEGGGSSSSEDEEDELLSESSGPFTADKDFFADLQQDLARHSQQRQKEALEEHWSRLEELEKLWEHRGLLLPPVPPRTGQEGATCTVAPGPRQCQPCPQLKPRTQLPPLPGAGGQPKRAPSGRQPQIKALQEESGAKGARNRHLAQVSCTSTATHGSH